MPPLNEAGTTSSLTCSRSSCSRDGHTESSVSSVLAELLRLGSGGGGSRPRAGFAVGGALPAPPRLHAANCRARARWFSRAAWYTYQRSRNWHWRLLIYITTTS